MIDHREGGRRGGGPVRAAIDLADLGGAPDFAGADSQQAGAIGGERDRAAGTVGQRRSVTVVA
jgi:hypothetical protein